MEIMEIQEVDISIISIISSNFLVLTHFRTDCFTGMTDFFIMNLSNSVMFSNYCMLNRIDNRMN